MKMNMKRTRAACLGVLSLLWVGSAVQPAAQENASPRTAMRVLRDVPYAPDAAVEHPLQTLDLYLPEGKPNAPLLFFVHGGAWRGGDKLTNNARNNRSGLIELCLSQGFGVASINYRLSPEVAHPAHVQDVARAFAWLHGNGTQYGLDVDSIIVAGHSAGAHLVSLLALDSTYLRDVGLTTQAIKGVIAISGVYDIPALFGYPRLVADEIWGGPEGRAEASPARKLVGSMPDAPPFLVTFTEENDMFGFDEQAKLFHLLLLSHDVPAQLADIPTRDHLNVVSEIGNRAPRMVNSGAGNTTILQAEDLMGPHIVRFLKSARDGSFVRSVRAVWPDGGPPAVTNQPPPNIRELKDVPYLEGPSADPKLNSLNLYLPEGQTNMPILFEVHGGGWRIGDKGSEPSAQHQLFTRLGWGVVTVNYRLSPDAKHPTQIQDVAEAMGWVHRNAATYNLDPTRFVTVGLSAGAHLVSLLALDTSYLERAGVPPDVIKGVIAVSGIYDVPNWPEAGNFPSFTEDVFGTSFDALWDASPLKYLSPQAPPFLLTYSDSDMYMMPEQAHIFYNAFVQQKLNARLILTPDRHHLNALSGVGQPVILQAQDVLGTEMVHFATEVAGSTPEPGRAPSIN
jgi:arylformamidase